jgi:NAD(P)-dependent dehydrogenase (short-subunit alcohol dehydrogenase family)
MRSVMITGASQGIGLEFVRQYLADGYKVYAIIVVQINCGQPRWGIEDAGA